MLVSNKLLGIVKRFLDALKGEAFLPDVFPSFLEAFTSLVKCNLSAEVFRSLALFVTYALHKPAVSASRTPMSRHAIISTRSTPIQVGPNRLLTELDNKQNLDTKQQVGARILEMYTDLLCEKGNTAHLKKFARTVTNKVCLPFTLLR
jgi:beige protein homolog 1